MRTDLGRATTEIFLIYRNFLLDTISVNQNYFCCRPTQISAHLSPSRPTQRASAVVTDVGRVAVDAGSRLTTAWISVRQNRVVLAPVAGVKLSEKRERKR